MAKAVTIARLGDVLHLSDRAVPSCEVSEVNLAGVYSFGRGLFKRGPMKPAETSYKYYNRLFQDDFVISQPKAWEGALARVTHEFNGWFLSPVFPTFSVDPNLLDPAYLEWFCRRKSVWRDLQTKSKGMGARRETVSAEQFLSLKIPLPPLDEQRRIVARIEELVSKIDEAKRLRANGIEELAKFKAKTLSEFRGRLAARYPLSLLRSLTKVTSGGTPSREISVYWNGDIPWIKTGELLDGDICSAEEHITQAGLTNSSAKIFPPDTVLIALYGQGQTRGRTGRLLISAATNQACCAILPCSVLDPLYLQWWLRSLYAEMREQAKGGAQPNWNGEMIKNLIIALPSRQEQSAAAEKLQTLFKELDRVSEIQQETARELDAMLPAILDKAFKGEL